MTAPATAQGTARLERFTALARDAQQEYRELLRLVAEALAAADRRDVVALVMALDACDVKQRHADPVVRELAAAREALRTAGPLAASASRAFEELTGPVVALGEQVMAGYSQLRDRTMLGRVEIGRELGQLCHADAVQSAYRPTVGGRNLNLVR